LRKIRRLVGEQGAHCELDPLFRTSVGTSWLQRTCGKPAFRGRTRKLAPISQSPQEVASSNSHEMCGKSVGRHHFAQYLEASHRFGSSWWPTSPRLTGEGVPWRRFSQTSGWDPYQCWVRACMVGDSVHFFRLPRCQSRFGHCGFFSSPLKKSLATPYPGLKNGRRRHQVVGLKVQTHEAWQGSRPNPSTKCVHSSRLTGPTQTTTMDGVPAGQP
jgi:hypothetical protein